METLDKNKIIELINSEKRRLGSFSKVANKCGVSEATISQMRNNNWELIRPEMWQRVSHKLTYVETDWKIVPTLNFSILENIATDAKKLSIFMAVSHRAGSGKTATLTSYAMKNSENAVFYIKAWEWSSRDFMMNLCTTLGIDPGRGYKRTNDLLQLVIRFFSERGLQKPQLIIDEADKLKPSAIRLLIPIFNELEDVLSILIAGTDNLEKEFIKGVQYNKKGYDELHSRFGRAFIHLVGAIRSDVSEICKANGITSTEKIDRIWKECGTVRQEIGVNNHKLVVEDFRRIKRLVQRELIGGSYESY